MASRLEQRTRRPVKKVQNPKANNYLLWRAFPQLFRRPRLQKGRIRGLSRKQREVRLKLHTTLKKDPQARQKAIEQQEKKVEGILLVHSTFTNTHFNLSNLQGQNLYKISAGRLKKKARLKKSNPFTAQLAAEEVAHMALKKGVSNLWLKFKGPGEARLQKMIVRGLNRKKGLKIRLITVQHHLPHNGCRPSARRRL